MGLNYGFDDFSFGGFRAAGGPTYPGKAYVVGERGPELFMPDVSGMVVPHAAKSLPSSALSGPSFSPEVVVNINNESSARVEGNASARFDGQKFVIDTLIRDVATNGPGIQAIGRVLGAQRKPG